MAEHNAIVRWQTSPGRRGTLTIIENSLFTIFACTWSIQHLNVPGLDDTFWEKLGRKFKWAVITLFFPEFLMAHAILEFVMAVDDITSLDEGEWLVRLPWWLRFSGQPFRKHRDEEKVGGGPLETTGANCVQEETEWTLTHCYFANMGGFYLREDANSSSKAKAHLLTARHFADSWESVQMPKFSIDDLNDKSKTDYFTKAIAIIQIAQLLLSLTVRTRLHLAFSQLETLTLAFAICGVLTYICYWYKPQDVRRPIKVQLRPGKELPPKFQQRTFERLWEVLTNSKANDDHQPLDRIRNDNIPKAEPQTTHYALYVLTALTAGFGSIHAIAWNFEFPTFAEQMLWRTATLVSTAVPPLALLAIPFSQILIPWGDSREFMRTCLRVMREYSWHAENKKPVQDAMKKLQEAYENIEDVNRHYRDIFREKTADGPSEFLEKQLLRFIDKDGAFQGRNYFELPDGFVEKFSQLTDILDGNSGSKRLSDEAQTNAYPQRVLFTKPVNLAIIYVTGIMYCLARVTIIGVAFSSLRRMPDSVYATTWTSNVPSVQ